MTKAEGELDIDQSPLASTVDQLARGPTLAGFVYPLFSPLPLLLSFYAYDFECLAMTLHRTVAA